MRIALMALLLASHPREFFERREVDFWGSHRPGPSASLPSDLWADSAAPEPVKRLLALPSRENAEAYLAWQRERMERLQRAMAAVAEASAPKVLYFSRPGCPACRLQDAELQGLPVARVPAGSDLWRQYEVTVTPTLVANGRVFRGFTPRGEILRELTHE